MHKISFKLGLGEFFEPTSSLALGRIESERWNLPTISFC